MAGVTLKELIKYNKEMNKKTTLTLIISILICKINAQPSIQAKKENYIQGVNNTINVDNSSTAILWAIQNKSLPNGKDYDPNINGKDLLRDVSLFGEAYGVENKKTLKRNIKLQEEFTLEKIKQEKLANLTVEELGLQIKKQALKTKGNFSFSKFLSYIIVLIISFVGLIIILDTFKFPLYKIFPNLEFLLFSFFETLVDIRLFIKDLF